MKLRLIYIPIGFILLGALGMFAYISKPIQLGRLSDYSQVLRANNNEILELRLTSSGHWREPISLDEVDPILIDVLIAYEDKRFYKHSGVDIVAVGRAAWQLIFSGKITSGASTLTMQTARLMHRDLAKRSLLTKLHQMAFALRLEHQWSKDKILETYLSLAPYGGNIEGIKAASQAWFQKPPSQLTLSEAALLVAIPQSPESRRPDRFPENAYKAKAKVIDAIADNLDITPELIAELKTEALPSRLRRPQSIAPHLFDRIKRTSSETYTTVSPEWQRQVSGIISNFINDYAEPINGAALIVERKTGKVRAYVGSADYQSKNRKGGINYLTSIRSPGSTLKPLIYAKAIDRKKITASHVFSDQAVQISGYTPTNFSRGFSGEVSLKDALIQSLNIPAIKTLQLIGAVPFENNLRSLIKNPRLHTKYAGLSLALGGFYLSPEDLMNLYLEFADPNSSQSILLKGNEVTNGNSHLVSKSSSKTIMALLTQKRENGGFATFKTGTSHNRQDAWAVQITQKHIVLTWLGTPDNTLTHSLTGRNAAYPVAQQIVDTLGFKTSAPELIRDLTGFEGQLALGCPKLIQFPETGEWIRTQDLGLQVLAETGSKWFLNGEPTQVTNGRLNLKTPGAQRISVRSSNCIETNTVYVQLIP